MLAITSTHRLPLLCIIFISIAIFVFAVAVWRGICCVIATGIDTHLICELRPYRAWSSGVKSSGRMLPDRSFWMPACLPRRKPAMTRRSQQRVCGRLDSREQQHLFGQQRAEGRAVLHGGVLAPKSPAVPQRLWAFTRQTPYACLYNTYEDTYKRKNKKTKSYKNSLTLCICGRSSRSSNSLDDPPVRSLVFSISKIPPWFAHISSTRGLQPAAC